MDKIKGGLFRITAFVADQAGCGNIRVVIPFILLNQLHIKGYQFQSYYNNIFCKDLQYYKNSAIIQFQRAATDKHLEFFELVRRKIKLLTRSALVYEIDDNLFDIPPWNFAYSYYSGYKSYIIEMLSKADALTVTTEYLKDYYSKYNSNIFIIPNYLPRFTWGDTNFVENDTKRPRVIYPCSSNHFSCKKDETDGDMGDKLLSYIRKTTDDYEWIFIGGMPLQLEDLVKDGKIKRLGWYSVYEYPRILKELQPDIGIAPLKIDIFNRSKSPIKSIEYTALGIPGVFTNIEPYDKMILKASSEDEFISHVESLKDINKRHEIWQKTYNMIKDDIFWEDNNYKNLKKFIKTYMNIVRKDPDF